MALHIRNPQADRLARRLAHETGETLTDAVIHALEERLKRATPRAKNKAEQMKRRAAVLSEIADGYARLPDLDDRTDDEILGYDKDGLPRSH
jgi:antitoxin VapB